VPETCKKCSCNTPALALLFYKNEGEGNMISTVLLRTSVILLLVGMTLGIVMGIRQDFALAPAHAHLNLVGFVLMFGFGLYYRLVPAAAEGRLPIIQATLHIVGAIVFPIGIAAVLTWGPGQFEVLAISGALIVFAAVVLFAWIVFRTTAMRPAVNERPAGFSLPI
jgi:peptidoglycan/LPS O-acetylase OafA/YrhL